MCDASQRAGAISGIGGGVLAVVVNVPATWYGLQPTDSYVFAAPPFSPRWISRELVPLLSVVACLCLIAGLLAVVRRDWPVAGRARRWGGVLGAVGLASVTVAVAAFGYLRNPSLGEGLYLLAGLAVGAIGGILLLFALLALAYGYARTPRPIVGYAFLGVIVGGPLVGYLVPGPINAAASALPVAVAGIVVGRDVLRHPEPLAGAVSD